MAITGGEWTLNKRHVDSSPYEILDSEGNLIAATIYGQHNGIDEARDNARLIAACPRMLAACRAIVEWDASYGDAKLISDACSFARVAVRKAEGKE